MVNALAAKGHNITVLTTEKATSALPNVHYIYMDGVSDYIRQSDEGDYIAMSQISMWNSLRAVSDYCVSVCEGIRLSNGIKEVLNYPNDFRFDLIFADYTCGPCLAGFVHKFNYPPLIAYTGFNNPPYTVDVIGGHNQFAYTPYHTTKFSNHMSFWQRAANMFYFSMES